MGFGGSGQGMVKRNAENRNMMRSGQGFKNREKNFKPSGKKFSLRKATLKELRESNEVNQLFIEAERKRRRFVFSISFLIASTLMCFCWYWLMRT